MGRVAKVYALHWIRETQYNRANTVHSQQTKVEWDLLSCHRIIVIMRIIRWDSVNCLVSQDHLVEKWK